MMAQAQLAKAAKMRRVLYSPDQMAEAIRSVRNGMAKKAAAKLFNVPKTTLLDKLAGRVPEEATRPGRRPCLTSAEEETLVNYAKLMCEIGYPLTGLEFRHEVKRILDLDNRSTNFNNNLPGRQWFAKFQCRHPDMTLRSAMNLGHERAIVSLDMIKSWYESLFKFLEQEVPDYKRMINNPRRIFNADESGFPLAVKTGRVLAPKGTRHVYNVVTNTKTQITVMACLNAFGDYVPPMILFPGERIRNVGLEGFPEAIYASTENGWMDSSAFVEFLKVLLNYAKSKSIELPILLIVDGHSTHMTYAASKFCNENQIVLYCLPANATHILQACDIGLFSPMKSKWKANVKEWQMNHIGQALSKKEFPTIFRKTWYEVATIENSLHGFRRSGMFPLSPDGIDLSKLGPSKLVARDQFSSTSVRPEPSSKVQSQNDTAGEEHCISSLATHSETNVTEVIVGTDSSETNITEAVASTSCPLQTNARESFACSSEYSIHNVNKSSIRRDETYVSPAFSKLRVPEPVQRKKCDKSREKMPKALSGSEALKLLRLREEKKLAELKAKEERKTEREIKKMQKQKEKEAKQKERELKKKEKEEKKLQKLLVVEKKRQGKRKFRHIDDDSDEDNNVSDVPYMDSDSSDFEEEFEVCPGCKLASGHPSLWIKCNICNVRWHIACADCPELYLLDDDSRKTYDFACPDCA